MDSQVCRLAYNDQDLITKMKEKIDYYESVMGKREKLMLAIVNNVNYLQTLHKGQAMKMKQLQKEMVAIE